MSTSKDTVADVLDRLAPLRVRARAMFGEYGVYCDEKLVAVVCDDRFFLKPTSAADAAPEALEPCPPFEGAKDWRIVGERLMQDRDAFRALVQATADVLPVKVRKPARKKARRKR